MRRFGRRRVPTSASADSSNRSLTQPPTTSARPPRACTARAMSAARKGPYPFRPFRDDNGEIMLNRIFVLALAARRRRRRRARAGSATTGERHLANVKQLTAGGENAEAYFSPDGKQLIYQTNPGAPGHMRSDFYDERRRIEQAAIEQGRPDDLRIFLPGRKIDRVRVHAPGIGRVPAASELRPWVCLADLRHLRHLPRVARRIESAPPHGDARV